MWLRHLGTLLLLGFLSVTLVAAATATPPPAPGIVLSIAEGYWEEMLQQRSNWCRLCLGSCEDPDGAGKSLPDTVIGKYLRAHLDIFRRLPRWRCMSFCDIHLQKYLQASVDGETSDIRIEGRREPGASEEQMLQGLSHAQALLTPKDKRCHAADRAKESPI